MKHRSTTPTVSKQFVAKSTLVAAAVLMAITAPMQLGPIVRADSYDEQIRAIEREVEGYNAEAGKLAAQADTLQNALNRLTAEKNVIQSQIDLSQAKYDQLVADIAANEKKIADNQEALGEILADLYVDDKITPLEMIASSKNIGDFLDKQEFRNSVRDNLTSTINEIKKLKKQLEADKVAVENVLKDQKSQREALAAKEAEQQSLLNQTKNDENAYRSIAASKNAEINKLRAQQAAENARRMQSVGMSGIPAASAGNGGYPAQWANAPMDSIIDNWALYNRECVSYVAWKVASTGRFVPNFGGQGHAYQWPATTSRYGIANGSTPKAGAAAVMYGGPYGHVMYVESVNGDGTITVSDYNLGLDGLYRYYTRPAGGLTYIYF